MHKAWALKPYCSMKKIRATVDIDDVKYIEEYYKTNYMSTKIWYRFLNGEKRFSNLLKKHPVIRSTIKHQFVKREALQSGHLNEVVCGISLATENNLQEYYDPFGENEIPEYIAKNIIETTRFTYGNSDGTTLLQLGGPNDVDFIKVLPNGKKTRIEAKDVLSKAGENDMPLYDEEGHFFVNSDNELLNTIAQYFNERADIFSIEGSNYHNFSNDIKRKAFESYCKAKKIDQMVFRCKDGNFVIIDPEKDIDYINFDVAELRPAGRNPHAVFTPKKLESVLKRMGATIKNGRVFIDEDCVSQTKGRGMSQITRIKFGSFFFVRIGKTKKQDEIISFNLVDVQQLKPTFSIHMTIRNF